MFDATDFAPEDRDGTATFFGDDNVFGIFNSDLIVRFSHSELFNRYRLLDVVNKRKFSMYVVNLVATHGGEIFNFEHVRNQDYITNSTFVHFSCNYGSSEDIKQCDDVFRRLNSGWKVFLDI